LTLNDGVKNLVGNSPISGYGFIYRATLTGDALGLSILDNPFTGVVKSGIRIVLAMDGSIR